MSAAHALHIKRSGFDENSFDYRKKKRCSYGSPPTTSPGVGGPSSFLAETNFSPHALASINVGAPPRPDGFAENIQRLSGDFPQIHVGVVTAILESCSNNLQNAQTALQGLLDSASMNSQGSEMALDSVPSPPSPQPSAASFSRPMSALQFLPQQQQHRPSNKRRCRDLSDDEEGDGGMEDDENRPNDNAASSSSSSSSSSSTDCRRRKAVRSPAPLQRPTSAPQAPLLTPQGRVAEQELLVGPWVQRSLQTLNAAPSMEAAAQICTELLTNFAQEVRRSVPLLCTNGPQTLPMQPGGTLGAPHANSGGVSAAASAGSVSEEDSGDGEDIRSADPLRRQNRILMRAVRFLSQRNKQLLSEVQQHTDGSLLAAVREQLAQKERENEGLEATAEESRQTARRLQNQVEQLQFLIARSCGPSPMDVGGGPHIF
uniref:CUE domain-containing protein n=1 Tax=Chromera velia CCMP2878 TaxID=1169474 RepID=A0A0G4HYL2_9ALVE|eukprot:Cvel_1545.t1-p1 / transcript=Cvel_1545.t1 / gene=Cvel_1545 / organism=Chromera_velia_CCMP2878 / gene_product=hypothetical protein / transcript_product=hypothetical protein / location=Cvel_scaffold54:117515-119032(+) / protein_length=429 / sequence_SO=supercontig / SO=protein_coding / is_pseudo=false